MSKTASAADAADLGQDSEVDRKQTVASNGQCHAHIYIAESLVQQRWLLNSSIYTTTQASQGYISDFQAPLTSLQMISSTKLWHSSDVGAMWCVCLR